MPSEDTQFKKGNPGGPGRPKGSRDKLSFDFIEALAKSFDEHGAEVIDRIREERPDVYIGTIGKLMPKLLELSGPDEGPLTIGLVDFSSLYGPDKPTE